MADNTIKIKTGRRRVVARRHLGSGARDDSENNTIELEAEFTFDYPDGTTPESMVAIDKMMDEMIMSEGAHLRAETDLWIMDERRKLGMNQSSSFSPVSEPDQKHVPSPEDIKQSEPEKPKHMNRGSLGQVLDYWKKGDPYKSYIDGVCKMFSKSKIKDLSQDMLDEILAYCKDMDR